MGTGSSFPRNSRNLPDHPEVVKRIPIEMKPRVGLGGALRSFGSLGRRGAGLRSTFSLELENAEVERVRREFEMYQLSRKAEMSDTSKKVNKLENENRRLRAELQALQKTCNKLRAERDAASAAGQQALERASCFETERDKVQMQFKIFRESKVQEFRHLLRTKDKTERALYRISPEALNELKREDTDSTNGLYSVGQCSLDTDSLQPSLDFAEGGVGFPDTRVDWQDLSSLILSSRPPVSAVIRVYIAVSHDLSHDVKSFLKVKEGSLRQICAADEKFLTTMTFSYGPQKSDKLAVRIRRNQMKKSCLLVAVITDEAHWYLEEEILPSYLDCDDTMAIFVLHSTSKNTLSPAVRCNGRITVIDAVEMSLSEKLHQLSLEMERNIQMLLGHSISSDGDSGHPHSGGSCQRVLSDCCCCGTGVFEENDQHELFTAFLQCSWDVERSQLLDRLDEHISFTGPQPPLLVLGRPGSGKSHLLARWLANHARKKSSCLVLYHFVSSLTSRSSCVLNMVQRLSAQMMRLLSYHHCMTSVQLLEEFPRLLEKMSAKLQDGIVLIIDSADRFIDCEDKLSWLLDPIPVKSRVIVTADSEACPQSWRSWPTLEITPFSEDEVETLIQNARQQETDWVLSDEVALRLVSLRNSPLHLTIMLSSLISNLQWTEADVDECLQYSDCEGVYQFVINQVLAQIKKESDLLKEALSLVLASRRGLPESVLFDLIPGLTWDTWSLVYSHLEQLHLLAMRSGLIFIAHQQGRNAMQSLLPSSGLLDGSSEKLIQYYLNQLRSNVSTTHLCDELLGLLHESCTLPPLRECLSNVDIFRRLYSRGRSDELLTYWRSIGLDSLAVSKEYFEIVQKFAADSASDVVAPHIADLYEVLGRFLQELGLLNQALLAFQRSLEIHESSDPDHPAVGCCFYQIGSLHTLWGRLATAESYYKQALSIWEINSETSHPQWVTRTLNSLAALYKRQGKTSRLQSCLHLQPQCAEQNMRVVSSTDPKVR